MAATTNKARQLDDLANALRIPMCYAANVRHDPQTLADDAVRLEASIAGAELTLRELRPSAGKRTRR